MMNDNLMTGLWCMDFVAIYKRQRFVWIVLVATRLQRPSVVCPLYYCMPKRQQIYDRVDSSLLGT
jgi:hypothetical protein